MSGISGNTFLLKTPSDEAIAIQEDSPTKEQFGNIGGFQSNNFEVTASVIETTNKSDNENMTILDGRGIKSVTVSGSGILQDSAIAKALEANQLTQKLRWFQIVRDSGRSFTGLFKIASYSFEGSYDSAVTFSITLNSSGAVVTAQET